MMFNRLIDEQLVELWDEMSTTYSQTFNEYDVLLA
ncbi:Acetyl-coenzyme A synthetase [Dirofilaria immitis]